MQRLLCAYRLVVVWKTVYFAREAVLGKRESAGTAEICGVTDNKKHRRVFVASLAVCGCGCNSAFQSQNAMVKARSWSASPARSSWSADSADNFDVVR